MAKMPALERLLLPSGCLDLRSTAALRQQEALSGRAFLAMTPRVACHFDIIARKFRFPHLSYMLGWHYESYLVTLKMVHLHVC